MKEPPSEQINGINLSTTGSVCLCNMNGISLGFLAQIGKVINGFSAALLFNFSYQHNGLQMAIYNNSYIVKGLQIGGSNSAVRMIGVQVGVSNTPKAITGLQIGVFNKSKKLRGIQIGIWNVNQKRKLPLINWNFKKLE